MQQSKNVSETCRKYTLKDNRNGKTTTATKTLFCIGHSALSHSSTHTHIQREKQCSYGNIIIIHRQKYKPKQSRKNKKQNETLWHILCTKQSIAREHEPFFQSLPPSLPFRFYIFVFLFRLYNLNNETFIFIFVCRRLILFSLFLTMWLVVIFVCLLFQGKSNEMAKISRIYLMYNIFVAFQEASSDPFSRSFRMASALFGARVCA